MISPGSHLLDDGSCEFKVWSPDKEQMNLHLVHPVDEIFPMTKNNLGYFKVIIDQIGPGTRYFFQPAGGGDHGPVKDSRCRTPSIPLCSHAVYG